MFVCRRLYNLLSLDYGQFQTFILHSLLPTGKSSRMNHMYIITLYHACTAALCIKVTHTVRLTWFGAVCSEIQPLEVRAAACSFNVAMNMLFTFVIGQCFVTMLCSMQWGVFLFFAGQSSLFLLQVLLVLQVALCLALCLATCVLHQCCKDVAC